MQKNFNIQGLAITIIPGLAIAISLTGMIVVGLRANPNGVAISQEYRTIDWEERNRAILPLIPRVRAMARRLATQTSVCILYDDLLQEGLLGAMRAWESYNSEQGDFLPYALRWAKGHMLHYCRAELRPFRICLSYDALDANLKDRFAPPRNWTDLLHAALSPDPQSAPKPYKRGGGLSTEEQKILHLILLEGYSLIGASRATGRQNNAGWETVTRLKRLFGVTNLNDLRHALQQKGWL